MNEISPPDTSRDPKKDQLLSFKATGRPLALSEVHGEFTRMRDVLDKPLTAAIATTITAKSGSHLLKLVSPRVDGDHAVLRIDPPQANRRASILPSVNAPDIPFCKVVFRPLEVAGNAPMSVVDHILNPVEDSSALLADFGRVFGADVLDALRAGLLNPAKVPLKLGAGEFPIIFVPRAGGGDLQITPVSPASTFMGIKRVSDAYFLPKTADNPHPLRARWTKQAVSSKPQNISGAIGGPRLRFMASMPTVMQQAEAELHRFAQGGGFPRWREDGIDRQVLGYAQALDADRTYNNADTRAALDSRADRLIREAHQFIADIIAEAEAMAQGRALMPPAIAQVLLRRSWKKDERDVAIQALSSPHFTDRVRKSGLEEELQ
ncbi:hypothetical protein BFP70_14460 [Thioclava sp. SK-1]|uniref:hypothetical protein n=1 Tax=Thioclava sp. SK-1 TaxID=1889770 RepID=UPI000826C77E|nr:hypothetical protein [Thioclava sp. SK-1]OCX62056.1 hypothetical protein BFP70_14460 [Thioclava sp. SK-1]